MKIESMLPLCCILHFLAFIFAGARVLSHSVYSDQRRESVLAELLLLFWF